MINDSTLDELWDAFEDKPDMDLLRVIADKYQEVCYALETIAEGIRWLADFERLPLKSEAVINEIMNRKVTMWQWKYGENYMRPENIPLQGANSPFTKARQAYEYIALMWFHMSEETRKEMRKESQYYQDLKANQPLRYRHGIPLPSDPRRLIRGNL